MAFNNYLEEVSDKPYFTKNSLAYYYDKMEGFAEKVEQAAKILNVTKEEVEKNITLYIEQNKNELDQRLAQWDGKLETFDSSVETLLSEWVDDGTLNHVIDGTLIDQRLAPVAAQLTAKLGRGEVSVSDIDKNKGLIDQTYLTDELKQQMAGTTPINATPADNSVTVKKLAFNPVVADVSVIGKNQFNKNEILLPSAYLRPEDGTTFSSGSHTTSYYIPVKANTVYTGANMPIKVFYDINKNYIGTSPSTIFTTPANTAFVRVSFLTTNLNTIQLEQGNVITSYEDFKFLIGNPMIKDNTLDGEKLVNGTISATKLIPNSLSISQLKEYKAKNLFDKSKAITGNYINWGTGALTVNATYFASDFIEIKPNTEYVRSTVSQMGIYDADKKFIMGISSSSPANFVTPANAKYVRVSDTLVNLPLYQLEEGTVSTPFQPFGFKIEGLIMESVASDKLKTPAEVFTDVLKKKVAPRIKLIGDSITHGMGGTGYAENGDTIPGGTKQMNPNGYSWAKSFKELMAKKYNATVINYGWSGQTSVSIYNNRNVLIETGDDLVIIQLGTNDRHTFTTTAETKTYQRGIIETAKSKGAQVILMSASPVAVENDNDPIRHFGMYDVDKAIRELAAEYGLKHISNYDAFLQFSEYRGIEMDTLLNDVIHPNDAGYDVMFRNILRNLNISYIREGVTK